MKIGVERTSTKTPLNFSRKIVTLPVFADDAQYLITSKSRYNNQIKIEENFTRIKNYFNDNGLQINENKTNLTEYMTRQKRCKSRGIPPELTVEELITNKNGEVRLESKLITDSVSSRFLGMNFLNSGTWDAHVATGKKPLLPCLRRNIGMLSRIINCTNTKVKQHLVNSFVVSKLNYMICVWGNATLTLTKKVQIVLNTAARLVHNSDKTTKVSTLMKQCNWLDTQGTTEYFSLLNMWKIIRTNTPEYMVD